MPINHSAMPNACMSRSLYRAAMLLAITDFLCTPNSLSGVLLAQGGTTTNPTQPTGNPTSVQPKGKTAANESFFEVVFSGGIMGITIMIVLILLSIISLIMLGEVLATAVRKIFIENASLRDIFSRRTTVPRERHLEDD